MIGILFFSTFVESSLALVKEALCIFYRKALSSENFIIGIKEGASNVNNHGPALGVDFKLPAILAYCDANSKALSGIPLTSSNVLRVNLNALVSSWTLLAKSLANIDNFN